MLGLKMKDWVMIVKTSNIHYEGARNGRKI